jgi:DNA-binding NarL/FixJ family response regulator
VHATIGAGVGVKISVAVCEDQTLLRAGLVTILRTDPDLEVVGEAGDGHAAIEMLTRVRPDVALVDIRMPGQDGLAVTAQVAERGLPTRVVVLTTFGHDDYVLDALRAGASAFLLKDNPPEQLLSAVHAVATGEERLDQGVVAAVIADVRRRSRPRAEVRAIDQLSERERDVLLQMAKGYSNSEIASALHVAPGTVKTHVGNILAKLGARDRVQAVITAYEAGLAS